MDASALSRPGQPSLLNLWILLGWREGIILVLESPEPSSEEVSLTLAQLQKTQPRPSPCRTQQSPTHPRRSERLRAAACAPLRMRANEVTNCPQINTTYSANERRKLEMHGEAHSPITQGRKRTRVQSHHRKRKKKPLGIANAWDGPRWELSRNTPPTGCQFAVSGGHAMTKNTLLLARGLLLTLQLPRLCASDSNGCESK